MFGKIKRFVGTTLGFAIMFATIALLTMCLNIATMAILNNEACIFGIEEFKAGFAEDSALSLFQGIVNGFFDFLYNESLRNTVVFIVILWLLSTKALSTSQLSNEEIMTDFISDIAMKVSTKITTFPNRWWFWLICWVTLFIPVLLAYTVAICIVILNWALRVLLAPIAYVILSYYVALTSKN